MQRSTQDSINKPKRKLGSLRGLVKSITPNADEPLGDFLEYETPKSLESTTLPFYGSKQRHTSHE